MKQRRTKVDLILEKIPPTISWLIILLPIFGGFFFPNETAYLILALNIYFLYRSASFFILLSISLIKLRQSEAINWLNRLQELDNISTTIQYLQRQEQLLIDNSHNAGDQEYTNNFLNEIIIRRYPKWILNILKKYELKKSIKFIRSEINRLHKINSDGLTYNWQDIQHIIIIPHWKEPYHILKDTLERIKNSNYPTKNISIVLAAEARDPEGIQTSEVLKREYESYFNHIWVNQHILLEGELVGKSSNMYSASVAVYAEVEKLGWDLKKVTITSCDADSQLPSDYFANITYHYVTTKDSEYKYYSGAILLYANIWKLPFFARVKNSMSTLTNVMRLERTDKLIPFSTYTLSLWLIKEIGFWSPEIVPEDYHTFFKGLFLYPDKVSTVPIYQRVYSDAAEGDNSLDTAKNNYMQERRWAWGISDDGWMIKNVFTNIIKGKIHFRAIYIPLQALWGHLTIGISILITFGTNIIILINPRFGYTVLGSNLPTISTFLVQLTILLFLFTISLDYYLKPKNTKKRNILMKFLGILEWFIQPIIGMILVVLPGIEAHTRLLFGKYLEYYLTKKK